MASFFTLNTGSFISGTQQIGNLAITDDPSSYPGYTWWAGAEDTSRYVLANQVPSRPANALIPGATVDFRFLGSTDKSDASYLALINSVSGQTFTNVQDATNWANDNGYYSSKGSSNTMVTESLVLYVDAANASSYSGTGTTWYDLSGNGYNGTLVNGVTWSTGSGGTFLFTGSNLQYIDFGDPIETRITGSNFVTYQGWFKGNGCYNATALQDVNSTPIFSKYYASGSSPDLVAIGFFNDLVTRSGSHGDPNNNSGFVSYIYSSGSGNGASISGYETLPYGPFPNSVHTNTELYADQWYMVTFSILLGTDVALTASQYVNNQAFGTDNPAYPLIPTGSFVNDAPLYIGSIQPESGNEVYMYGECGAFWVYNKLLSQAEVTNNFNVTKARYGY